MQVDLRDTKLFKDAEARARAWYRPGEGSAVDLAELAVAPDGQVAAGTATVCEALEGTPTTRIALVDLTSGELRIVTNGPRSDRQPRWAPEGGTIAFLSDRAQAFASQLYFLDVATGAERAGGSVEGWVEYLHWSPDGKALLLGVAGFGADLAGAQGGFSVASRDEAKPSWLPAIDAGHGEGTWRSAWIYDRTTDTARQLSPDGVNIWEAVWCGPDRIAAICSDQPGEEAWYTADLRVFDLADGKARTLLTPQDQLGWLSAAPSGRRIAVVEAVCSDRTIVAGDVRLIDTATGAVTAPETLGADVVQTIWRGEDHLLFAALQCPDSLVGLLDRRDGRAEALWRGTAQTPSGARFPEVTPLGSKPGDCLFLREGFLDPPVLGALQDSELRDIRPLVPAGFEREMRGLGTAESVSWTAPDGTPIQGWLLRPQGDGPHPLVLEIHGGPVWLFRPRYIGRNALAQMLLADGYAVLQVNPRGSSGRGQEFARQVFGDMGGADTHDYLSGLDAMVARGIADPARLGVTGGSYGGFMSSWLITQDSRFAAAVPVAPVTNWVSEHLTCHIPYFCEIFLADKLSNPTGRYFTRSPIHHADKVKTPALHICGALDKNTPAGQALEFHHALLAQGVESVLATYPEEGHGIRKMPASFDYLARVIGWFRVHMPAKL